MNALKQTEVYQDYLFYLDERVPEHTRETIVHYLIFGWHPSGFMEAILTGDLYRAVKVADMANKPAIPFITDWVLQNYPYRAYGDKASIDGWCEDKNNCRTKWVKELDEKMVWEKLST